MLRNTAKLKILFFSLLTLAITTQLKGEPALQILRNGGFEEDEMTFRGEPASSCGGGCNDQWFNMQDRFPDGWEWLGVNSPSIYGMARQSEWPRPEVNFDSEILRSGERSLRIQGTKVLLRQTITWNSLTDLYRDKSPGRKLKDHTSELAVREGLFQDMTLSGWFRSSGIPEKATAQVSLSVGRLFTGKHDLVNDTAGWQEFRIPISASDLMAAAQKRKGQFKGKALSITVRYTSRDGMGKFWLDDLKLSVSPRQEQNLLPNSSFELPAANEPEKPSGRGVYLKGASQTADLKDYPAGWSAPMKWVYLPGPYYYVWNNWQHFFSSCRGAPSLDSLVSRSGSKSLRMELLGGDEYAIDSPRMIVHQTETRPIEVTAWVKADRLRHFDLMLIDQDGFRVPSNQILTYWGGNVAGTHDWISVRKIYLAAKPMESCRLRIGARGFNAQTKTDIGEWHAFNQVSTVWVDDISVREIHSTEGELKKRGVEIPDAQATEADISLSEIFLGERLYGENSLVARVENRGAGQKKVSLEVAVTTPTKTRMKASRSKPLTIAPGTSAVVEVPYQLNEFSSGLKTPGSLEVSLFVGGKKRGTETYRFGTWPSAANVRTSKACLDESENPILVAINLGVTKSTLGRTKKLDVEIVDRRTGKSVQKKSISDIHQRIRTTQISSHEKDRFYFYMPRAGLLDHRNLLLVEMDISDLPVRPWNSPESDWVIRVTGRSTFKQMFTAESHPFARLTKMEEELPPIKEVTIDPKGKFYRVNGKPFLPFAQSHANGAANGRAPQTRAVAFRPETGKVNAMNCLQRWSWAKASIPNWEKGNLYAPMLMSGFSVKRHTEAMQRLKAGEVQFWESYGKPVYGKINDLNQSPWMLAYFLIFDEAIMEAHHSPDAMNALKEYANAVRQKLNRPIGIMDNHSQFYPFHDDDRTLDVYDALYFEREAGSVFRPFLVMRNLLKRKERWVMVDLPQTYENVPHETERYRALLNMFHGFRGWFGIQGCADPSLYRLLRGEMEHLFSYMSADEGGVEVNAPVGVQAKTWMKGSQILVMAEQHNPIPHGEWQWKEGLGGRKGNAHSGVSKHLLTPIKEGYAIHGFNDDIFREIGKSDVIEQDVFIPAEAIPKAIFLIVPGNGSFNYIAYWGEFDWQEFHEKKIDRFLAGECYSHAAYGINWYRTSKQYWLDYQLKHRFPPSCFKMLGPLPPTDKWVKLTVPLNQLGLTGRANDGLMFMTSGNGKAWWGSSVFKRPTGNNDLMLDGRIGRAPEALRNCTLRLPGYGSASIRVIGENRSLKMQNGQWTDDLAGEDLFGFFGDGYLGDGITYGAPVDKLPEALELGYTYDDSPRCVRLYEITLE